MRERILSPTCAGKLLAGWRGYACGLENPAIAFSCVSTDHVDGPVCGLCSSRTYTSISLSSRTCWADFLSQAVYSFGWVRHLFHGHKVFYLCDLFGLWAVIVASLVIVGLSVQVGHPIRVRAKATSVGSLLGLCMRRLACPDFLRVECSDLPCGTDRWYVTCGPRAVMVGRQSHAARH